MPSKEWLDDLTPSHPVLLTRMDGHMALLNSLALEKAGVTVNTVDPPGGTIGREVKEDVPSNLSILTLLFLFLVFS